MAQVGIDHDKTVTATRVKERISTAQIEHS